MMVSIITVCLNAVETIEATIKSVLVQTYKNIEYIIIDGGSTDGTLQVIEKYRDQISVLISEKDDGIYDAMNKGIALAHGDYIGIINADDWYEKNAVEYVVQTGRRISENIGVITGQARFIKGEDSFLPVKKDMERIWTEMPIAHPSTFIKKSVYERYGKYDTHYKIAADYELVFRLYVNRVKFYFCGEVLANYRVGGISGKQKDMLLEEDIEILSRYQEYCSDPNRVKESIQRKKGTYLIYRADKSFFCKTLEYKPDQENNIFIFGCGYWGRELCQMLKERQIAITGFVDNNSSLWGTKAEHYIIEAPDVLRDQHAKVIIAVLGDTSGIRAQINALSIDIEVISLDTIFEKVGQLDKEKST